MQKKQSRLQRANERRQEKLKIADISIKRPVTIVMIMLAALLIGTLSMLGLPLDLYPELSWPTATVVTIYPGASPELVEQQVTNPIEEALQSLSDVEEVSSVSMQNVSSITVQFKYGVDLNAKIETMRGNINGIKNKLPSDVEEPVIKEFNPSDLPIMTVALAGDRSLEELSDIADNTVYPALQHVSGVGEVNQIGNLAREIQVEVDAKKLNYYNIGIQQVTQAVAAHNTAVDVGELNRNTQLIPLNISGQFSSPTEVLAVPIQVGPKTITVGDVAKVVDGWADVKLISKLDGSPSVGFSIKQASGGNTVRVSDAVRETVAQLAQELPEGVHLKVVSDNAESIRETVKVVSEHTLFGFFLGVLVMLGILRNFRTTLVIALAIPISIMTTFILMRSYDLTINTITLGSLAIALGSLVDFSVVVLESIFRARQRGLNAKEAAGVGSKEVGTAVMVAALAQIVVFGPALFTSGIAGQIFRPMSLVVVFSHIVAVTVALTLTPMLASRLLTGPSFAEEEKIPGINAPFRAWAPFDWFGKGMHLLTEGYRKLLAWSLNHRLIIIGVSLLMIVAVIPLFPQIGKEMMPPVYNDQVNITVTLAGGTSIEQTAKATEEIENRIRKNMPEASSIYAQIGGILGADSGTTEISKISVTVAKGEDETMADVSAKFEQFLQDIPGAKVIVKPASALRGPETGTVEVVVTGSDVNTLELLSDQVTRIMRAMPELKYIDNQLASGIPSYKLHLDYKALAHYGLSEQQVISALFMENKGATASTFYQGDNSYDIVVKMADDYARDVANLMQTNIMNSSGQLIPLANVASLTLGEQPTMVSHYNGLRAVHIKANVYQTSVGEAQAQIQSEINKLRVPQGYTIEFGKSQKLQEDAFKALGSGLLISVILVYMIMAGMFESLLTPFVIMFSLPPTFVGAVLGLFVTHKTINMNSLMGLIMLIGLVTNAAIVLVDYTNQLREEGMPLKEALLQAGPVRLRPILLTVSATVLAMLPLLLFGGTGTETLAPMAAVITFGLTLSTLVTLVLVPVMYVNMDQLISRWSKKNRHCNTKGAPKPPLHHVP